MDEVKKRSYKQIVGEQGIKYITNLLPAEWVVRELTPDYGIDLDVELFEKTEKICWTLGEHVFVQVKATETAQYGKADFNGNSCQAIKYNLEIPELNLVERMGSAFPVLLVVVDLIKRKSYFVCLNDYISKVLPIQNPNYRNQQTVTIYIPIENELDSIVRDVFEWYGKRIKIYSMLSEMISDTSDFDYKDGIELFEYGSQVVSRYIKYDIWRMNNLWQGLLDIYEMLRELSENDLVLTHVLMRAKSLVGDEDISCAELCEGVLGEPINAMTWVRKVSLQRYKDTVDNVNSMFQECCREWFLPNMFFGVHEN